MNNKFIDTIMSPFKPMYALKQSEANDSDNTWKYYPYKIYKVNFLGYMQPKNNGATKHRYTVEDTKSVLLDCFKNGNKVFIMHPDKKTIQYDDWENDLIQALNAATPENTAHSIVLSDVSFKGTRNSGVRYEDYNQIIQFHK